MNIIYFGLGALLAAGVMIAGEEIEKEGKKRQSEE
jgi:hypothetical protein